MKRNSSFTLIELLVVIVILGILMTIAVQGFQNAMLAAHHLKSGRHLQQIGQGLTQYSSEYKAFPCEESYYNRDGKRNANWKKAKESTGQRKTFKCMQTLRDSTYGNDISLEQYTSEIGGEEPTTDKTDFTAGDIGYHYVNGIVTTSVLRGEKAVMRDLNLGFNSKGNFLTAGTQIISLEGSGEPNDDGVNYVLNWYQRIDDVSNCDDFDNYNRQIDKDNADKSD